MKKSTIHLSLPRGSRPPELHVQTDALTVAHLSTRATEGDVSKTTIASMTLAGSAAAAAVGQPDMTIDFKFLLSESAAARGGRNEVRELTAAIAGMRLAYASRTPQTAAEHEERAAKLAAGEKALAAVAPTLAKFEALCGLSSGQIVAEVVTRALSQPAAAAAPAPVPARSPGVPKEDAEIILRNNLPRAHEHWQIWTMCALAAAAAGREFTVPRPKAKPTPPAPTPPTPTATPPGAGAVDKLVTAGATAANTKPNEEGQP